MPGTLTDNLHRIQDRIAASLAHSGRPDQSVTLIAVTKSVGIEEIRQLRELGVTHFGENRVQNAGPKISAEHDGVVWHMIGNIQRRKAKDVVRLFDRIDSVDRIELADELAARTLDRETPLPILLEVNVSGEETKHGFAPDQLSAALEQISGYASLRVEGLLTMAPYYNDPEHTRPIFAHLRALADQFDLPRVSMGMSNDYEVAVEEGATEVRIGTALFGDR